jgi:hypothetical protein
MARDTHIIVEELQEVVFSLWPMPRLYNRDRKVAAVVQQFITELSEAVPEKTK